MFETKQIRLVLDGNGIIFMGSEEVSGWWSVPCRVRPSTSASMFGHPQLKREAAYPYLWLSRQPLYRVSQRRKQRYFGPRSQWANGAPTLVYNCPVSASPHTQDGAFLAFAFGDAAGGIAGARLATH
ncbi:uncharacterized protein CLUP02_01335 [Colletotrichum lupini]|uniref:Uncharacterized protein n=1 Tax=Colletotrichum lupini TaxID=145971 RepID=A0A9Q8SCQ7_9PEZI|nr:uncharacterized protein CLUP02_01335 [Colletotrichum lupini]UQC74683.1 hypothetical protein CLUP02_01335 [Colletotrichum lupini]